ncbi:hypothetical protein ACA910_014280 [Epithemia clementina (nom. ined.)]
MGSGQSKQEATGAGAAKDRKFGNPDPAILPTPVDSQNLSSGSLTVNDSANTSNVESSGAESKCPMHREDGSYSYDWLALFRPSFPHGPTGKKPLSEEEVKAKIARRATALDASFSSPGGVCPVQHREYNVYAQPIDPSNNMPENPNQLPAPQQTAPLSTNRVNSSIPKGGAADGVTWTYPSPQMFYNALARKGKLEDTREEEMESVVALHNNMNEKTWKKVLEWEDATTFPLSLKKVEDGKAPPKLLKFQGRPKDLSPKAWLKHNILGHPLPFDRHDWTILRHNGTTVRYVIDYYFDETRARDESNSGMPDMKDFSATPSLLVDVRPALDGPSQLWNRAVTMPFARWSNLTPYEYMPLWPTNAMRNQVTESMEVWKSIQAKAAGTSGEASSPESTKTLSEDEAQALKADIAKAVRDCRSVCTRVNRCKSDDECSKASLDLTICMGKVLCPLQHTHFQDSLAKSDETKIGLTLERLGQCVVLRSSQHDSLQRK